jgi:hypothetical protein
MTTFSADWARRGTQQSRQAISDFAVSRKSPDARATIPATADVDIEPADQGTPRDLRLILGCDPGCREGVTAPGAGDGQWRLKDSIAGRCVGSKR